MAGVANGFDFALPELYDPAPKGLYTLQRSFDVLPLPPNTWNHQWPNTGNPPGGPGAAGLPRLQFKANALFSIWVAWKQFEPTEGMYDFSALTANIVDAEEKGWLVGIRLLTSRVDEAAPYLAAQGISTKYGGSNYDPSDARFHARYLALLDALRSEGFCQLSSVQMVYVGCDAHGVRTFNIARPFFPPHHAQTRSFMTVNPDLTDASASYGDEYIGPSATNDAAPEFGSGPVIAVDDPASYEHVRERLDGWARVCEGVPHKVLMGGESAYGTSLGFGTRNGFVEHYWYQLPDAAYGQQFVESAGRDYIALNASSGRLVHPELMLGEENEEYAAVRNTRARSCPLSLSGCTRCFAL